VIAKDLSTPQDAQEKDDKSKGNAPAAASSATTAAQDHGADRAESGFTIEQMISEYRALRASVIRLWTEHAQRPLQLEHVEDLTRFNEAIDQALAESVSRYSEDLSHSKEMFLAILGHDLRTPIGAVLTSSRFMLENGDIEEPFHTLTERIASSAVRMNHMVGDLLDFTRSRLGGGIPITPAPMNMETVAQNVINEVLAAYPHRTVNLEVKGDALGEWDAARVSQALSNLITNALEHGASDCPVSVHIDGGPDAISTSIHNAGAAIPPTLLSGIFNPMKVREKAASGPSGNLGLGLYIAERIINAHRGSIHVRSTAQEGTTFNVLMPRRPSVAADAATNASAADALTRV
jgi:signal transduction histidine kinase